MDSSSGLSSLSHAIQLAVAPVFLLSGIGALLAVLTNRLSRVIDRARALEELHPKTESSADKEALGRRIATLSHRARLISRAILLATVCAVLISSVVAAIFAAAFFGVDVSRLVGLVFITAMLCLIGGLITFLREVFVATRSLRIGVSDDLRDGPPGA